jgi:Uma2 family endonuclease
MILATSNRVQSAGLTFEDFIELYRDDNRVELIDGEVFDLEPTGAHEEVVAFLDRKFNVQIDGEGFPYFVLQRGNLKPLGDFTGFRPDLMVVDKGALAVEPLWKRESILTLGSSVKLAIEVVSSNWQNDYARKLDDFALMGIPEYWIVDYAALGGVDYIGYPKQPTLTICRLVGNRYQRQLLRGDDAIGSAIFPGLQLTAGDVLAVGKVN